LPAVRSSATTDEDQAVPVPVGVRISLARVARVAVTWKLTTSGSWSQPSTSTSVGLLRTARICGGCPVVKRTRITAAERTSPLCPDTVVRMTEPVGPEGRRKATCPGEIGRLGLAGQIGAAKLEVLAVAVLGDPHGHQGSPGADRGQHAERRADRVLGATASAVLGGRMVGRGGGGVVGATVPGTLLGGAAGGLAGPPSRVPQPTRAMLATNSAVAIERMGRMMLIPLLTPNSSAIVGAYGTHCWAIFTTWP
jgi:hypothetical protein